MSYFYRQNGQPIQGPTNGAPFKLTPFSTGEPTSVIRGLQSGSANTDIQRH